MENRKEEFLKIVCESYLIVILAVVVMNVAGRKTTSEKGGVRNEK